VINEVAVFTCYLVCWLANSPDVFFGWHGSGYYGRRVFLISFSCRKDAQTFALKLSISTSRQRQISGCKYKAKAFIHVKRTRLCFKRELLDIFTRVWKWVFIVLALARRSRLCTGSWLEGNLGDGNGGRAMAVLLVSSVFKFATA